MCIRDRHNEKRKVKDLVPWEQNPRQMSEKQVKDLEFSLKKFNLMSIPVINTDNLIISGHQRLKVLSLLGRGEEEIDVRVPNRKLTADEFKEANLRENKNVGDWNWEALADFDSDELIDFGFEPEVLEKQFNLSEGDQGDPSDSEDLVKLVFKVPASKAEEIMTQLKEHDKDKNIALYKAVTLKG
jgi:ParB-like chromosome segregation protein Spo0J